MFNIFKKKDLGIEDVLPSIALSQSEIRKKASILVIDNESTAFPIELIRAEGYNIQQWEKVKSLRDLEEGQFDLIILDIHGICSEEVSSNGGIGVLEHLKKVNPAQIVIAYSGKKFDLNHERFWRIADDYLGKPTDLIVAKNKIDALLQEKFTASYYWSTLSEFLKKSGVDGDRLNALSRDLAKSIKLKEAPKQSEVGKTLSVGKDVLSTAWIITQIIYKLATP